MGLELILLVFNYGVSFLFDLLVFNLWVSSFVSSGCLVMSLSSFDGCLVLSCSVVSDFVFLWFCRLVLSVV